VQRVAKGRSLKDLVESGWRVPEEEVKRIAIEVLDVLQYLGSLRPPVYHRDIKVIGSLQLVLT
jgi:serine/threonine protein kinase